MKNHKKVLHLIPLKEDEIYVNLKKVNIFTKEHLETLINLRVLSAHPHIYGTKTPKGVKYIETIIINTSEIDDNNKEFAQLARVGMNPEFKSISNDIKENGYSLAELPIAVQKQKNGIYVIVEGRTRYKELIKLGVKNIIADVFQEMSLADALRFALSYNNNKKPFGKASFVDIKKGILQLIRYGEISTKSEIQDEVENLTTKLTASQISEIVFAGLSLATGEEQVKSFPDGRGSKEWLTSRGYVDSRERVYVPMSNYKEKSHAVMITNEKKYDDEVTEILYVVHGGSLNYMDFVNDWKNNVKDFKKNFDKYEKDVLSLGRFDKLSKSRHIIHGCIPMVKELEDKYPMDKIVLFNPPTKKK